MTGIEDFAGAKGVVLLGGRMLCLMRDDRPALPFPGLWDLPGGGREGRETPRETLIREGREELGLDLARADWLWARAFPAMGDPTRTGWLFVLRLPERAARGIALGTEGQGWALIAPRRFAALPDAVPALRERVRVWLSGLGPGDEVA
jgi:8-oxo-dGTP diphosphatase